MNIFVIGDLHLHNWSMESLRKYQEKLLNEIIIEKVKELNPTFVVFLGDIFHVKKLVDKQILERFTKMLRKLSTMTNVHILAGNHDLYEGKAVIDHLSVSDNVIAVTSFESLQWNGQQFIFIPYYYQDSVGDGEMTKAERFIADNYYTKDKELVIFSHVDIGEVPYEAGHYIPSNKAHLRVKVLTGDIFGPYNSKGLIVNGHYHTPSVYDDGTTEVVNVGSTFGFTRADANRPTMFLHLKWDDKTKRWVYETLPTDAPTVVVAKSRKEYEELKKLGEDKFTVFFSPISRTEGKPANTEKSDSNEKLDLIALVKNAIVELAQKKGIRDVNFGLNLVEEVINGGK